MEEENKSHLFLIKHCEVFSNDYRTFLLNHILPNIGYTNIKLKDESDFIILLKADLSIEYILVSPTSIIHMPSSVKKITLADIQNFNNYSDTLNITLSDFLLTL